MANSDARNYSHYSDMLNHSATPPTSESMDQNEEILPVLVIGSAVAGTVFALQLLTHPTLRARYRPIIFDSSPTLPCLKSFKGALGSETTGQSGAAVALTKQAMWPLRQLQLGPELDEICQNTEELTIYRQPIFGPQDGSQTGVNITSMAAPGDLGILGGMWTIERGPLQALLIKKVLERGGEVLPNKKLVKIVEHANDTPLTKDPSPGPIEAIFEDQTSYHGALLIGADGAWSTVRKHLYTTLSACGTQSINETWKPDFQNLQIVHGVSHARTTDTKPVIYSMGLRDAGCGTWTLKGSNRQYWTIYTAPVDPPPHDAESRLRSPEEDESLGRELGMQVYSGGYGRASTEALLERYKNVWHPSAGTFGNLFDNSEKIIRVGLWQKLFTRISNVSWMDGEERPKECDGDMGVDGGKGNIVLIGDAARVLMPTSGQGAAFAIEDATVLANCILNNPHRPFLSSSTTTTLDFSTAIKAHTRQRLPRYKRLESIASFAARLSVGRTWSERVMRDYLSGLFSTSSTAVDGSVEDRQGEGVGDGLGAKRKERWWEKWTSDRWLTGERFEVREERVGEQGKRGEKA